MPPSALVVLALLGAAPFEARLHVGSFGGQAFLRGETLLVGNPEDPTSSWRQLATEERQIPAPQLAGFQVLTERCDRDATRALTPPVPPAEGFRAVAWAQDQMDGRGADELVLLEAGPVPAGSLLPYAPLRLVLVRGGQRVAEQPLDVTTFPCDLGMADVDGDGRPELIFAWLSAGGSGVTRGATVFELAATR